MCSAQLVQQQLAKLPAACWWGKFWREPTDSKGVQYHITIYTHCTAEVGKCFNLSCPSRSPTAEMALPWSFGLSHQRCHLLFLSNKFWSSHSSVACLLSKGPFLLLFCCSSSLRDVCVVAPCCFLNVSLVIVKILCDPSDAARRRRAVQDGVFRLHMGPKKTTLQSVPRSG